MIKIKKPTTLLFLLSLWKVLIGVPEDFTIYTSHTEIEENALTIYIDNGHALLHFSCESCDYGEGFESKLSLYPNAFDWKYYLETFGPMMISAALTGNWPDSQIAALGASAAQAYMNYLKKYEKGKYGGLDASSELQTDYIANGIVPITIKLNEKQLVSTKEKLLELAKQYDTKQLYYNAVFRNCVNFVQSVYEGTGLEGTFLDHDSEGKVTVFTKTGMINIAAAYAIARYKGLGALVDAIYSENSRWGQEQPSNLHSLKIELEEKTNDNETEFTSEINKEKVEIIKRLSTEGFRRGDLIELIQGDKILGKHLKVSASLEDQARGIVILPKVKDKTAQALVMCDSQGCINPEDEAFSESKEIVTKAIRGSIPVYYEGENRNITFLVENGANTQNEKFQKQAGFVGAATRESTLIVFVENEEIGEIELKNLDRSYRITDPKTQFSYHIRAIYKTPLECGRSEVGSFRVYISGI